MITASTKGKVRVFDCGHKLALVQQEFHLACKQHQFEPLAWAIFPNHYHAVIATDRNPADLEAFVRQIHARTAREVNRLDDQQGRSVWYRYWDTALIGEKAVYARIAYVHYNPVRHGIVKRPEDYPFCSARWMLAHGEASYCKTVLAFPHDLVRVPDDF